VELDSIRRLAERHQLFLETGAKSAEPRLLARVLSATRALGAGLMRVVPEIAPGGDPAMRRREIERIVTGIKEVLPVARAAGIRIAVENHGQIPSAELGEMVRAFGDRMVGACLDTMNSVVLLEHPSATARILAPLAISVHLKDFVIEASPRGHRILGVQLGEGLVDCREILREVRDAGHDPNVHLELYIDRKEREAETLAWEEQCIESSLRYARENLGL
jgi:sugar phosphate isomerase/epimerase